MRCTATENRLLAGSVLVRKSHAGEITALLNAFSSLQGMKLVASRPTVNDATRTNTALALGTQQDVHEGVTHRTWSKTAVSKFRQLYRALKTRAKTTQKHTNFFKCISNRKLFNKSWWIRRDLWTLFKVS